MPEIREIDVPTRDLPAFKAQVKQVGARIIMSAPIPTGYAMTVEFADAS